MPENGIETDFLHREQKMNEVGRGKCPKKGLKQVEDSLLEQRTSTVGRGKCTKYDHADQRRQGRGLRLIRTGSWNRKQDEWAIRDAEKLNRHRF
jgi:hypothetical protein